MKNNEKLTGEKIEELQDKYGMSIDDIDIIYGDDLLFEGEVDEW